MRLTIILLYQIALFACSTAPNEEQKFWENRIKGREFSKVPIFKSDRSRVHTIDARSNEFEQISIKSIIASVRYLELELTEKSMLGDIDFIRCAKGNLYVFSRGLIFCFDLITGKFKYNLYTIGRGPNEIISASDFDVDERYIYVMDDSRATMSRYTHDGKFVNREELPYRALHFKRMKDGNYLIRLSPFNDHLPEIDGYNIIVADSTWNPLQKAFYQYSLRVFRCPYFANANGQYFAPQHQTEILQYANGRLQHKYHLNFGSMSPDPSILEKTYGGINSGGKEYWGKYLTRSDCFQVGHYIIQQYFCGKDRKLDRSLIVDTRDNRSIFFHNFHYDSSNIFGIDFNLTHGWGVSEETGEFFCQVWGYSATSLPHEEIAMIRNLLADSLERLFIFTDEELEKRNPVIAFFTLDDQLVSNVTGS